MSNYPEGPQEKAVSRQVNLESQVEPKAELPSVSPAQWTITQLAAECCQLIAHCIDGIRASMERLASLAVRSFSKWHHKFLLYGLAGAILNGATSLTRTPNHPEYGGWGFVAALVAIVIIIRSAHHRGPH
jgi:hypothetical protein